MRLFLLIGIAIPVGLLDGGGLLRCKGEGKGEGERWWMGDGGEDFWCLVVDWFAARC